MHIHRLPTNSELQMNALYAAQQAEAKRKAEETRKGLSDFASILKGEAERSISLLDERQEGESGRRQQKRQQEEQTQPESEQESASPRLSSWA